MHALPGYEQLETLYESPHSTVYRARRAVDGRRVILKVLGGEYPSPLRIARFEREFRITRALAGDGVVDVLGLEEHRNTKLITFADGGAESLDRVTRGRPLPPAEVLRIACRLAEILARVHASNIVHKDLNPANVIRHPETGALTIIDFGCATELSREGGDVVEGTLAYMSPEQTGRMNRETDYRTDFYSLGATIHHLATGGPPFAAQDALELIHCHLARVPPPIHELNPAMPPMLSAIVLKLLAKTAEDRYQSAAGLRADLARCLDALARGESDLFELGRADVSDRFQIPARLYGREDDLRALFTAFERASAGPAEVVFVEGDPGVGKSSLVREALRPIGARRGYVAWGKFDHYKRDVPYAALIHAFKDLVRQMLSEGEEELAARRRALAEALGPNGRVITDVVPEVALILGEQPAVPELPPFEAQVRFNVVFRAFVGALGGERHPLVLVLDDLQWADLPSLKLLELMIAGGDLRNLLLVFAWRANEVDALHPLAHARRAIADAGVAITVISPGPLAVEHVVALAADTLRCAPEAARPLAEIAVEKTAGNPFFLGQFLRALHAERLITFDSAANAWSWSVEAIRKAGITDNVIELMVARVRGLPARTQEALRLAACLGGTFALSTLATALDRPRTEAADALWPALAEGAVVPIDAAYKFVVDDEACDVAYRFVHDHVQQSVYSLIAPSELAATHLRIGRLMLRDASPAERAERLFDLVSHLNLGSTLITDQPERDELARLDLAAGRRMRDAAAYRPALRCLATGRALLGDRAWSRRYDDMLALTTAAAEAADLDDDLAAMDALVDELLANARALLDKVPAYEIRLRAHLRRRRHHDCLAVGADVLALLGVELAPRAGKLAAGVALARTKLLTLGKSLDALAALPPMTDPRTLAAMRVLNPVGTAAYLTEPNLMPGIVHELVRGTLKHGLCPESAPAFSGWGLLACAALGEYESGLAFGNLGLRLTERLDGRRHRSQALFNAHAFMSHWTRPLREALPGFVEGYHAGLGAGDLTAAIYCAIMHAAYGLLAGLPLDAIARDAAAVAIAMRRFGHESPYVVLIHQAVENLMDRADDPRVLSGAIGDESVAYAEIARGSDRSSFGLYHAIKLMLAYLFHDPRAAVTHGEAVERYADSMMGLAFLPWQRFFKALAELAIYPTAAASEQRALRRSINASLSRLRGWAKHAPMNQAHRVALIEAELARVTGDHARARERYDRAIDLAREHGYLHDEALAAELAAAFYAALGRDQVAVVYALDARHAWLRWGAAAKVKDLDARYADLFRRKTEGGALAASPSITITDQAASDTLDLMSVMKASQAISSEIVLDGLLETLMRTLLESAGARRGVLLLEGDSPLVVELDQARGDTVTVREGEEADVPIALIRYVERTSERVVIGDTASADRHRLDEYAARRPTRSVLCAPILKQQRLLGVLYLENDLVADAFTPARCRVLEALSAQAAISIENARLYDTLESRVKERTRELSRALDQLRETQRQLIIQEKLASLSVLTSGIAHELKNPLNFVNNFAELSTDLVDEIGATVAQVATRIDPEDASLLAEVAGDLRENVTRIQEHGRRAARIVSAMLEHSRARVAEAREVDLNLIVRQHADAAFKAAAAQAKSPGPALEWRLDDTIGPMVVMPEAIGQVVGNLVSNAVYFSRAKGRGAITVATRNLGDRVEVRVRDDGTGIPASARDKVFTPFFTTRPTGEGTGLGLFISYDIVARGHGGTIDFETEEGRYAEFVVTLPRAITA